MLQLSVIDAAAMHTCLRFLSMSRRARVHVTGAAANSAAIMGCR
jgi:hypothetical protein